MPRIRWLVLDSHRRLCTHRCTLRVLDFEGDTIGACNIFIEPAIINDGHLVRKVAVLFVNRFDDKALQIEVIASSNGSVLYLKGRVSLTTWTFIVLDTFVRSCRV